MNRLQQRLVELVGAREAARSMFPHRMPHLRDAAFYRSRLLKILEADEDSRSGFLKNLLIGNGAGLVGIAALLARWPDTAVLIRELLPSALAFTIGMATSSSAGLYMRALHHSSAARIAWIIAAIEDGEAKDRPWPKTKRHIRRLQRALKRRFVGPGVLMFFGALTIGLLAMVIGMVLAIIAVARTEPPVKNDSDGPVAPPAHFYVL